jgi:hypothetical protein
MKNKLQIIIGKPSYVNFITTCFGVMVLMAILLLLLPEYSLVFGILGSAASIVALSFSIIRIFIYIISRNK